MKRDPNLTYFDPVKDAAKRAAALAAAIQKAKGYPPLKSC